MYTIASTGFEIITKETSMHMGRTNLQTARIQFCSVAMNRKINEYGIDTITIKEKREVYHVVVAESSP
jgi:hypothetical protein